MDEFSTTSDNLDQADEDVLSYTVSDEALEAAAEAGVVETSVGSWCICSFICCGK
jgi:hypothetical protein